MSTGTLFVVLGAGSSYDASIVYGNAALIRPPLVRELFDDRWHFILNRYPMAKGVAPDIVDAMSGSGTAAVSLEDYLRTKFRHSADPYDQRRWYSIVAYLQALLLWVSVPDRRVGANVGSLTPEYRYHPDRLSRFVNMALDGWDHVCFITLNYDLILDRYLAMFDPLQTMPDFIRHARWSVIKLHGSVNWHYRLTESVSISDPPANLDQYIERNEIIHDPNIDHAGRNVVLGDEGQFVPTFPALSAPLGEEDELVCPEEHIAFVQEKLGGVDALDVLVIGYSAYDNAVLNLLAESGTELRSLFVVSEDAQIGQSVAERIGQHMGTDVTADGFRLGLHGGLANWVTTGLHLSYPDWARSRD